MKRLRAFAVACAVLGACCSLHSAGYIKFDGVDGESTDKDHKQWIDVSSVSVPPAQTREAGSGLATGRRTYEPIRFTKRVDKASPVLAKRLADKSVIPTATVSIDGRDCVLTNARISEITKQGEAEVVTITYEKIEWKQATPPPPPDRAKPQQQSAAPARATN